MTDRFVMHAPGTGPIDPVTIVATAENEVEAQTIADAQMPGHPTYYWVEYQLEADGTTRCNGKLRPDIAP